jgi:hypothetical protein
MDRSFTNIYTLKIKLYQQILEVQRFRVQGSGFKVQGSGFRVQGSRFRVQGSGFRVQGSMFRVQAKQKRTTKSTNCRQVPKGKESSGLSLKEFGRWKQPHAQSSVLSTHPFLI